MWTGRLELDGNGLGGAGVKEVRKGLQLGPLGIGSFGFLLLDVLA